MNLRGLLVTVIDLAQRVALDDGESADPATSATAGGVVLLVPKPDGRLAGCLVDSVRDVIAWPVDVTDVPASGSNADGARIVCGVADHRGETLLLVDLRALVDDALR